jgi:hypothetical protein
VNLVFACAFVVILAVVIHLSSEISSLEDETRTLTEEIALLRLEVRAVQGRADAEALLRESPPAEPLPEQAPSAPDDAGARNLD